MNGRVYDPAIGRFLSADPILQDPANGQSYNRFSYVLNNPTNLTDPTGFVSNCAPGKDCPTEGEAEKQKKEKEKEKEKKKGKISDDPCFTNPGKECFDENGILAIISADGRLHYGTNREAVAASARQNAKNNSIIDVTTFMIGDSDEDSFAGNNQAADTQRSSDKTAGALAGGVAGAAVGVAVSGGCDSVSFGICVPANPGIVAAGTAGGALIGSELGPPVMESSRKLAKNIFAFSQVLKLQGQHSHHIVAELDPRAALSAAILNQNGMSLDSAFNGMNMNGNYHNRIHTDVYHAAVQAALTGSQSYVDVAKRLTAIKVQIHLGIFPF